MLNFFRAIKSIKKLKKIEPRKEWLNSERLHLRSLLKSAPAEREVVASQVSQRPYFKLRLVSTFAAVMLIISLSGAVNSAQAALPNDFLYPIKLLSEKFQGFLIVGDEQKIEFSLKLAEKRLDEASIVATSTSDNVIAGTILRAELNLEKIKNLLEEAKEAKKDARSAANSLRDIQKTFKRLENLADRKEKLEEKFLNKLPKALAALEKIGIASINVEEAANQIIITINTNSSSNATSTVNSSTTINAAILNLLRARATSTIERADAKIKQVEAKIGSSTTESAIAAAKKLNEAKEKLAEAKAAFNEGNFKRAIEKASEAYKKAVEAEARFLRGSSSNDDEDNDKKDKKKDKDDDDKDRGRSQILKLLTKGAGKSRKVPEGLLKAPGIDKKLDRHDDDDDDNDRDDDRDEDDDDEDDDEDDNNNQDHTAPVISSVQVSEVTTSSVKISWSTNESSDSRVNYGVRTSYGGSAVNASSVTSHSIVLNNLNASTTYNFQVVSKDAAQNTATSSNGIFVTAAVPPPADTTPPTISSISVTAIASLSASISWATNEAASGKVYYSLATPVNLASTSTLVQANGILSLSHSFAILGLNASSTYYFVIEARDGANNVTTSGEQSFTTAP